MAQTIVASSRLGGEMGLETIRWEHSLENMGDMTVVIGARVDLQMPRRQQSSEALWQKRHPPQPRHPSKTDPRLLNLPFRRQTIQHRGFDLLCRDPLVSA